MPSTNFLNPSSFVMSLDKNYSGAEFTIQSASIPDISSEGAILSFKSVNTAMAAAHDPIAMAEAFNHAVRAGRQAFEAGLAGGHKMAVATSPLEAFLEDL